MNIYQLSTSSLQDKAKQLITDFYNQIDITAASNEFWQAFSEAHDDDLIDAYGDWIVVNLDEYAQGAFTDDSARMYVGNDCDITDEMRINYARDMLSSIDYDDPELFPSPALIQISDGKRSIYIGYFVAIASLGLEHDLIGIYANSEEFKADLLKKRFIDMPLSQGLPVDDELLLQYWNYQHNTDTQCEHCGSSNLLEWFYGMPPPNTDLSKYKMGGCIVEKQMFTHYCNDCNQSSGQYYSDMDDYISELERKN